VSKTGAKTGVNHGEDRGKEMLKKGQTGVSCG
jgi:hypothetical protein